MSIIFVLDERNYNLNNNFPINDDNHIPAQVDQHLIIDKLNNMMMNLKRIKGKAKLQGTPIWLL